MNEKEKELLQARHRLEEWKMRNREKQRKARTHRLIQEGAILEKCFPDVRRFSPEDVETILWKVFENLR